MMHIEVRELLLNEEVRKGMMAVEKVKGDENLASLITKFLGKAEVEGRLMRINVEAEWRREERGQLGGGGSQQMPRGQITNSAKGNSLVLKSDRGQRRQMEAQGRPMEANGEANRQQRELEDGEQVRLNVDKKRAHAHSGFKLTA